MSFAVQTRFQNVKERWFLILHLLLYDGIFVAVLEVRALKMVSGEEMSHLIFVKILRADVAVVVLVIFVIDAVFAVGRYVFHGMNRNGSFHQFPGVSSGGGAT